MTTSDIDYLQRAIELAKLAEQQGEVPVGAVLVCQNQIIGEGWNSSITQNDPTAHAEIGALRKAGEAKNNYRLVGTTLYVTLEPCLMCVGALIHARVERLVFGALDPRAGAVVSVAQALDWDFPNHRIEYHSGLLEKECSLLLSEFFRKKR